MERDDTQPSTLTTTGKAQFGLCDLSFLHTILIYSVCSVHVCRHSVEKTEPCTYMTVRGFAVYTLSFLCLCLCQTMAIVHMTSTY